MQGTTRSRRWGILAGLVLCVLVAWAQEETPSTPPEQLESLVDKASYILGNVRGRDFFMRGIEINSQMFLKGFDDALASREPALTPDQMGAAMEEFQAYLEEKAKKEGAENLEKGKAFLEQNKSKEGVKVLPSGLQYKVLTEGSGRMPTAQDRVKAHYRGKLITGEEFDSSYKRNQPIEVRVTGQTIRGWSEALQLMKEGAKWELYVPPGLAYGERRMGRIPPNATLIFEIELLEILETIELPPTTIQ